LYCIQAVKFEKTSANPSLYLRHIELLSFAYTPPLFPSTITIRKQPLCAEIFNFRNALLQHHHMQPKKTFGDRAKRILKFLGPGIITGASDDDPSGIVTYTQAGAGFGFATLWTALLTFPLMATIQGMCARIGLVTSKGLTGTLKDHYPKPILYIIILCSFPAISMNIGSDLQGMGAVAHLIVPRIPAFAFSILFTILLTVLMIRFPYERVSKILKWLCLSILLYIVVPFLVHPDWTAVLQHTFIPEFHFTKEYISIFVAILGTTISPYLFFWQATMEAEDVAHQKQKIVVNKRVLSDMATDVNIGMFLSNVVMFFLILTAGAVLFKAGMHKIDTVDQAAKALEPLTGKFSYLLFAIGVIGTGFLAIPVLAGSLSYIMAETFNFPQGLDKKFGEAKSFYITIIVSMFIGLCLEFLGISPIKALLYTAILYGITAPVLIAIILHIGNNKKILGEHTNSRLSNVLGFATLILMTAAAIALFI
jgi:NRAMP (natural resistance-associated macrophage protein)-like metal ion transporter